MTSQAEDVQVVTSDVLHTVTRSHTLYIHIAVQFSRLLHKIQAKRKVEQEARLALRKQGASVMHSVGRSPLSPCFKFPSRIT